MWISFKDLCEISGVSASKYVRSISIEFAVLNWHLGL